MNKDKEGEEHKSLNFIEQIIEDDKASGKHDGRLLLRFPPHPNGYLHIGHAKSICLNFGLAEAYNGACNLRFDDTNPSAEKVEYIDSIKRDIEWLGFKWKDEPKYASDYFAWLYELAQKLINEGKAYVDEQSQEEIAKQRTNPQEKGVESPHRNRPAAESLALLEKMKSGEMAEGSAVLRAKIDMNSPNMWLRDPAMYRIKHTPHHRTGSEWYIYPMYDWAHGQSDAKEEITHSLCTLEFENHRPLYEWFVKELGLYPTRQIEFARLNLNYTVTSKRKLQQLVQGEHVSGWDDPRMPTISGMRRRGYPPAAIRTFCEKVGVAKRENLIDIGLLEHSVREELNKTAPRRFGIQKPLKMVITNWPPGKFIQVQATNNPEDPEAGTRDMPFGRELWIEQDDFMENPPKKFFRMAVGREVRLKYGYIVKCEKAVKNDAGEVVEVHCTYDPDSRSGADTTGKKVKATLGWVFVPQAVPIEVREYDRLFKTEQPDADKEEDFLQHLNPDSLVVNTAAVAEPSVKELQVGDLIQFERQGYFRVDEDSTPDKPVFNKTVGLRDSWKKK
jgi:glutaminyl-tRNA synthetase